MARSLVGTAAKGKGEPARPAAPTEWEVFCKVWRDHFGDTSPTRAAFDLWQLSRKRALGQAARLHSQWAGMCPAGSGRAYNHSLYASAITDLYKDE
ncbi:hypothetical protein BcepSauron_011 [Burkholderia phage BcepSauron]|uniref:Uncharacterized protein n=1 Tax=Burkholderia phage BcepSauron TaxID=2530033 RepID=A0A482MK28_9CAUD|nr:hypothetical protein H1O17_gp011 [Burkholderia phage BcepSauron]QBQ74391.1 hypothetical protein BcepSauron_011 [Burkholderia phage BcepSauron]